MSGSNQSNNIPAAAIEAHINFVHGKLREKTAPSTREPAHISSVLSFPLGPGSSDEVYTYFGVFGPDVAKEIGDKTQEVSDIHLERLGTFHAATTNTEGSSVCPNWGLGAISNQPAAFNKELQEQKTAARNNPALLGMPFDYHPIKNKGQGATIFILDSGFSKYNRHGYSDTITPMPFENVTDY